MEIFNRVKGIAAPLLRDNIDTDLLIPSREMTEPGKQGYGEKLLTPWRYETAADGSRRERPDFVLNRQPFRQARFLIAGANFGSGSSREQAAWALRQFGFRAVLAPSFGTIFQNNCYRNGLLPIVLRRVDIERLAKLAEDGLLELAVDLEQNWIECPDDRRLSFTVPASERAMLLAGLDAIGLTLQRLPQIEAFQQVDRLRRPWIWLDAP
jgi:3-isopropylmalate/(R)-2-methylmalate dehydratase small subunit